MNDEKFIIIPEWMIEMGLTGNRLIVYAVIYGYSRNGNWYQGATSYLCKRTGLTTKGVRKVLKSLCDDGFLRRRDRPYKGIKFVDYQTVNNWGTKFPGVQSSLGNKSPEGGVQSSPHVGYKVPTKVNNKVNTKETIRARGNKFTNYPQRDYDYDELERRLTALKGGSHG